MKKLLSILLAAAMLAALLCGCAASEKAPADERSASEIWAAVGEKIDAENLPASMELDAAQLETYYGLTDAEVSDFVCLFPLMNVTATEIFIAKCVPGQEAAAEAAAESRKADLEASWGSYLPEQLALVQDARIVRNGQWLLFAVSEQADGIEAAFNEVTK